MRPKTDELLATPGGFCVSRRSSWEDGLLVISSKRVVGGVADLLVLVLAHAVVVDFIETLTSSRTTKTTRSTSRYSA